MPKKIYLFFLLIALCVLTSCGGVHAKAEDQVIDLSSEEAIPLSAAQNIQRTEMLLAQGPSIEEGVDFLVDNKEMATENYTALEMIERNADSVFFVISDNEKMSQFPFHLQIYEKHLQQGKEDLLYDTSEAYWINEMRANDNYLYWVEYAFDDVCYRIMQCQLESGEISCIAERGSEVSAPCLEVSSRFLTWYDIFDERVEIVVFDIEKQEFMERAETANVTGTSVKLYALYERLKLVDDGITYFLEDEEGKLYVRRENLCTGQTTTLLLRDKRKYSRQVGCFSDERYIGWHTEYGEGSYYFYDTDEGKLYSWDVKKDGMHVFSKLFSSGKLYINNSQDNSVYVWDLETGQVYCQSCGDGALQFGRYGDGQINLEVRFEDRIEMLNLCDDSLFSE